MLSLISAENPIGFVKSSGDSNVDWKSVMSGKRRFALVLECSARRDGVLVFDCFWGLFVV